MVYKGLEDELQFGREWREGVWVRWVHDAEAEPVDGVAARRAAADDADACRAAPHVWTLEAGLFDHELYNAERRHRELGQHRQETVEDRG